MIAGTRDIAHISYDLRQVSWLAGLWIAAVWLLPNAVPAQAADQPRDAEEAVDGLFITVQNPITSSVVNRVVAETNRFLDRASHRGLKIVYDFNPDNHASGTAEYGSCHDLAEFLLDLHDVTTIAFVHAEVTRHTVLPVLACKEIVMSSEARLGDVLRDRVATFKKDTRDFYESVANAHGRCPAIVLKMVDKNIEVVEGTRNNAVWWIDKQALPRDKGFVQTRPEPVLPAGSPGLYTAAEAQKFGLCNLSKETRRQIKDAYRLPPRSLLGDPLQGRTPSAWHITVKGPVTSALRESLERRVSRAIAKGANLIILQLECGGGDTVEARKLADFLRDCKDDSGEFRVLTVAYLTPQARDTATFLALGCTEIVMEKNREASAKLGDFEQILQQRPDKRREGIVKSLEELVEKRELDPLLGRAMVYRELAIHRVRSQKGQFERGVLAEPELHKDKEGDKKWLDEGLIQYPIDPDLAVELGLVQFKVEGPARAALPEIYKHYGVERAREAGPDWLDDLAAFLGSPVVGLFLVMIGIVGLVLELKMPGLGFPGVIAAICFLLYFWAHSQLHGDLAWLAALLFFLGLILIALEVFVVPGFGVTGVSGIVLVVVSLALATLVKKPETTQEWMDFGAKLSTLGISLAAAVAVALIVASHLPQIPYANRLVLAPPHEPDAAAAEEESSGLPQVPAALLGALGEAATDLRPAGKARFGDEFVDVVAEGSYVVAGSRIQVIEIEGNRVVVKEV